MELAIGLNLRDSTKEALAAARYAENKVIIRDVRYEFALFVEIAAILSIDFKRQCRNIADSE